MRSNDGDTDTCNTFSALTVGKRCLRQSKASCHCSSPARRTAIVRASLSDQQIATVRLPSAICPEGSPKKRIHKDKSEATKRHYNELIKSEKSAFEEKYKNIVADHKKILERLKNIFKKEYNQTVAKYSEKHKASESRNHDKFYTLSTIEPQLREDKNFYYIDIKTPPHEKDNYQVSAYDRKVKVLFNRRSEERLEEGRDIVTSNKSEVITREFAVKDIVNDRKLTQSYQKGVLSYRLPKA